MFMRWDWVVVVLHKPSFSIPGCMNNLLKLHTYLQKIRSDIMSLADFARGMAHMVDRDLRARC